MAGASECPKCGAAMQPTDLNCMECGADILEERRKIEEEARRSAPSSFGRKPGSMEALVAQGLVVAGETSDLTRMRGFDRQEADRMKKELPTVWATVAIAGFLFIGLLALAISGLRQAGLEGVKQLSPAYVRGLGWAVFTDPGTTGAWFLGMSLGGGLCLVGQGIRGYRVSVSIKKVAGGQKPDIVGISAATKFGILALALFCPVIGLILGIALQMSADPETKHLGIAALKVAVVAAAVIIGNVIWAAASKLKPASEPKAPGDEAGETARYLAPLVLGVFASWRVGRRRG
jgi:hypothetical protein